MAVTLRLALGGYQKNAQSVPTGRCRQQKRSMAAHVRAMLAFSKMGACRPLTMAAIFVRWRKEMGWKTPFDFSGICASLYSSLSFCRGIGPFAGWRCPAIRRISTQNRCQVREWLRISITITGWIWRASAFISGATGAYLLGQAGGGKTGAGVPTKWCVAARYRAGNVIGRDHAVPVLSPALTVKPKRCGGSGTRFPTAAVKCLAEYRQRGDMGIAPSWRRGRGWVFRNTPVW